jgi:hypothetical protein
MDEKWPPIPGMPGYEASDLGNIRSWRSTHAHIPRLARPKVLKPWTHDKRGGYQYVHLVVDGKSRHYKVHRLVTLTFLGPSDLEVRHKDDNPSNNILANLFYGTREDNLTDKRHNQAHRAHMEARYGHSQ